jgi:hypothetical protein
MVFSTGLTVELEFLVTLVFLVLGLHVVLLLGAEVGNFSPDDIFSVLVESVRLTERPFRITGSFSWLLVFCSEVGRAS